MELIIFPALCFALKGKMSKTSMTCANSLYYKEFAPRTKSGNKRPTAVIEDTLITFHN